MSCLHGRFHRLGTALGSCPLPPTPFCCSGCRSADIHPPVQHIQLLKTKSSCQRGFLDGPLFTPKLSPKHSLMKSQQRCDVTWEGIFQTQSTLTNSEKSDDCIPRWRCSLNEQLVTKLISSAAVKQVNRVVHFGNFCVLALADAGKQWPTWLCEQKQ